MGPGSRQCRLSLSHDPDLTSVNRVTTQARLASGIDSGNVLSASGKATAGVSSPGQAGMSTAVNATSGDGLIYLPVLQARHLRRAPLSSLAPSHPQPPPRLLANLRAGREQCGLSQPLTPRNIPTTVAGRPIPWRSSCLLSCRTSVRSRSGGRRWSWFLRRRGPRAPVSFLSRLLAALEERGAEALLLLSWLSQRRCC